ncbi:ABC transporter ATP-binding protein/permease [Aquihabitans sp. G128]|uniref:ABC transporter ATP-binding protein n=1 Tax=Aquihabitans sp. G128 TaxID=2849779 RepID=UPI001C22A7F5|nr:ABC transporter ATP-binding protein [Aquihabitans sp. G128]QXC62787.1 ABC transporter ATP-binding protein/permease [Aquihabitans sp. G128]
MSNPEPTTDARLLAAYLRPERRRLSALVAILVVAMVLPLAGPVLVGRFVDAALDGEASHVLVGLALAFLATTLTGDGLQLVVTWLSVRLAWRVGNNLRSDLCRHALSLDLDWHGDHSPGQLIERIDGDIDAVTKFSSTAVLQLLGNAILVVGVLLVSAFIDWRASVLIGATIAAALAVMVKLRRIAVPFYDDERDVQAKLYGDVEERLGGLEDLRANGAGRWAEHRLQQHSAGWWRTARRAAIRGDGSISLAGAVFAAGSIAILALGVWQCRRGELSVGAVLTLLRFSQLVSDPLWRVAEQLAEAQKAIAGTRRAARLLATEPVVADGPGPDLPAGALAVELRDVTFGYGTGHPVLDRVDLVVPAGTSVGIVGRTGSGKTTVGRLVARLWDTERGAVLVGGVDVRTLRLADLRSRIGIVTQEVELFRASLRDNLTVFGTLEADDELLARSLVDVGLGTWLASLPDGLDQHLDGDAELSAGEGQLLAFARVLLADPAVVILDEASSRLDPATEERLTAATDRLLAGRTSITIAHRLATLDRVDRICVLDHGRVVEHDEREVLAADVSSRYHGLLAAGRSPEEVAP